MLKREGHSHTEFCPHGSGDDVELMIQKAIKLGFKEYSITEHAPLPQSFKSVYSGKLTGFSEASISMEDVEPYLKKAKAMKDKYANQIKIHIGFEVDYLPGFEDFTKAFLDKYGPYTDDGILSVHFMKGINDRFWCVDDTLEDFQKGLMAKFPNNQELFSQYFSYMIKAVSTDLGIYAPKRIGHITLIRKFQDYFDLDSEYSVGNLQLINKLLMRIKNHHDELDLNAAGLYKKYCNQPYPDFSIVKLAKELSIPLVYGSDAHGVSDIGRGYHALAAFLK